ncbi:hypothetical protein niasHT_033548 [Heterodera trifolii]|uniref:UPF3 domain-containing protein n=1 Tax=Heterodera trifolii TaxID=157864 RepID=A0ABD2IA60_9BILA
MTVVVSGEEETKSVKKHKEKDEMTKVVLRRLPPGIAPADLHAQFAPLPAGEPHAFWFCAAPGSAHATGAGASDNTSGGDGTDAAAPPVTAVVEDDADEVAATLRRARCAFARAYLVFREEKNALSFAERFNGYVFVDRNGGTKIYLFFIFWCFYTEISFIFFGIESMAIVELAPNQTVPKHSAEMAKQCDERVNTLTNDVAFLKFLRRREAATAADADGGGPRRVTDFDELVRQLEEKQRRLEEGQVQETPLTEFIRQMALEKARKPRRSSALKAAEMAAAGGAQLTVGAKEIKSRKMVATDADEGNASSALKGASRTKTRRERRRRKELRENGDGEKKKAPGDGEDGTKSSANAKGTTAAAIRIKVSRAEVEEDEEELQQAYEQKKISSEETRKSRRRGSGAGAAAADGKEGTAAAVTDGTPMVDGGHQRIVKRRGSQSAATAGADSDKKLSASMAAATTTAPKSGEVMIIKNSKRNNKERPEREIYRPGHRKPTAAKSHKTREEEGTDEKATKK